MQFEYTYLVPFRMRSSQTPYDIFTLIDVRMRFVFKMKTHRMMTEPSIAMRDTVVRCSGTVLCGVLNTRAVA